MKKIIIAITFAFAMAAGVQAQDTTARGYRSFFGSESTEWHVDEVEYDQWGRFYKYNTGDDTVISGLKYKKLEVRAVHCTAPNTYEEQVIDSRRSGFVREDTTEGKLWVRNAITGNEDCLVVDMSLSVGDEFWSRNRQGELLAIVRNIYTDSLGRKVLVLDGDHDPMLFIEGVGTTLWLGMGYGLWSKTYCVFHDDSLTYRNRYMFPEDEDIDTLPCWGEYRPIGIDENRKAAVSIYPNPAHDVINIMVSNVCNITLYDIHGNILQSYNGSKDSIDISEISCGIVIVSIATKNGVIHKRIIKI